MHKILFFLFSVHGRDLSELSLVLNLVKMIKRAPPALNCATLFTIRDSIYTFNNVDRDQTFKYKIQNNNSTDIITEFIKQETREPAGTKYIVYMTGHSWMFYFRIRGVNTCYDDKCKKNIVTFDYIDQLFRRSLFKPDIFIFDSCLTTSYELIKNTCNSISGYIIGHQSHGYTKGILCPAFIKYMAGRAAAKSDLKTLSTKIARIYLKEVAADKYPQDICVIDVNKVGALIRYLDALHFRRREYDIKHSTYPEWNVYDLYSAVSSILPEMELARFARLFADVVVLYLNNRHHTRIQSKKHGISFILKNSKTYPEDVLYEKVHRNARPCL